MCTHVSNSFVLLLCVNTFLDFFHRFVNLSCTGSQPSQDFVVLFKLAMECHSQQYYRLCLSLSYKAKIKIWLVYGFPTSPFFLLTINFFVLHSTGHKFVIQNYITFNQQQQQTSSPPTYPLKKKKKGIVPSYPIFKPDVIPCDWLGSKYQLANYPICFHHETLNQAIFIFTLG